MYFFFLHVIHHHVSTKQLLRGSTQKNGGSLKLLFLWALGSHQSVNKGGGAHTLRHFFLVNLRNGIMVIVAFTKDNRVNRSEEVWPKISRNLEQYYPSFGHKLIPHGVHPHKIPKMGSFGLFSGPQHGGGG